ncbi:MAG: hypothetical protein KGO92_04195 [Bacteroidota bacterium]|nr:hypothetical protein [Bacteroidota bacterium]
MENGFIAYLQQLEFLLFFSGYALLYILIINISETRKYTSLFFQTLIRSLPLCYALAGSLYLGLLLKNIYPVYTIGNLSQKLQYPLLTIWGLLSLLCWIPLFRKKGVYSFLHSLLFFFLFVKGIIHFSTGQSADKQMVRNHLTMYTLSLLLYLVLLILMTSLSYFRKKKLF